MFNLLTPLTRGCVKTGTAKPGALSVANLRTHPSTETRIDAVVSVLSFFNSPLTHPYPFVFSYLRQSRVRHSRFHTDKGKEKKDL